MKKVIFAAMIAAVAMFGLGGCATTAESYGKQKVVYHINYDNPKAQAGALRNINNHINAVGAKKLDVKVVLHGKGLSLLIEQNANT